MAVDAVFRGLPRFNFNDKLYLCCAFNGGIGFLYKEIKTINKMRNKLAHNPDYHVSADLNQLIQSEWIKFVIPNIETVKEESDIINLSSRAICSIIHGIIRETHRDKSDYKFPSFTQFI